MMAVVRVVSVFMSRSSIRAVTLIMDLQKVVEKF